MNTENQANDHGVGHVAPLWALIAVAAILMVLTYVTVAITYVDFGPTINLLLALGIAAIKASFVALFFMHLYWDRPLNGIIFVASLLFLALFLFLAMMDTMEYAPQLIEGYAPLINR